MSKPTVYVNITGNRQVGKTAMAALIKETLAAQGISDVAIEQHKCMRTTPEDVLATVRAQGFDPDKIAVRIQDLDAYEPTRRQLNQMTNSEVIAHIENERQCPVDLTIAEVAHFQRRYIKENAECTVVKFNPYTGTPRHPDDIASDPQGVLILAPGRKVQLCEPRLDDFLRSASASGWKCDDIPSSTNCGPNDHLENAQRMKSITKEIAVAHTPHLKIQGEYYPLGLTTCFPARDEADGSGVEMITPQ